MRKIPSSYKYDRISIENTTKTNYTHSGRWFYTMSIQAALIELGELEPVHGHT